MRINVLKLLCVAPFALALSACNATGMLAANEPAHISKVQVSLAPQLTASSAHFAEKLRAQATQDAARFGRAGAAKELRIAVQRHSYKNPALSLLIGDANYAGARIAVVDVASGKVQGEAEASAFDNLAINGLIGAAMAASQDKQKVDQILAERLSRDALTKVYGSSVASAAYERPAAAPEPEKKPDVAPKAPAKQTPMAASKPNRTAVAQPVAVVR
ncbi:hypothetical protein IHQ68_01365 [Chelatococcus sambhunathii]|uniref:Lipoprotein n=1 Tax=Chelatococcus sambhunathii TaxID=363953 RepID=A0ABU1DAY2_9HYPH|nr:hypothetical protein [Chelatococcus sambhunathii]MDR4305273.1 hypothetical protein [Chelatococcus sambhunathii]